LTKPPNSEDLTQFVDSPAGVRGTFAV